MNKKLLMKVSKYLFVISIIVFYFFLFKLSFIVFVKEEKIVEEEAIEQISVKEKIVIMAKEYNVDIQKALDISECESQFGKYPSAFPKSTAKGVYMFIDKTWENYCKGDVMNEDDNIRCFMINYNKYPDWWIECDK